MEHENTQSTLLGLIERPAFLVSQGCITEVNEAARQLLLIPGTKIDSVITDDLKAYQDYTGGSLSLTVTAAHTPCKAQVLRTGNGDIFVLDTEYPELRAVALAAQHLRNPLNSVMTVAEQLSNSCTEADPHLAQLQRGLHRLHRIICNMSDSYRYQKQSSARLETTDITSVFNESIEAIDTHLSACGIRTDYSGLSHAVVGLADREMLERAVYNLISNAVKFMTPGSTLDVKLTQNGNILCFTVQNQNRIPMPQNRPFSRYLREPGIEDSRNGIGLGMALVRAIAACHGGTVLVDNPTPQTTRITMTLCVSNTTNPMVRSTITLPISDYTGDRNRGLLELSEILPANVYETTD